MKDEDILKDESVESLNSHSVKEKNKKIILLVLKKHKISILIVILLIMLSSTFSWFIFNKTIDMQLHAKVKEWNIILGNTTSEKVHEFVVDDLYPGIQGADPTTNTVSIENSGEVAASIKIDVTSITLFGEELGGTRCVSDRNQATGDIICIVTSTNEGTVYTLEGFPFVVKFTLSSDEVAPNTLASLVFDLYWEYERDDPECFTAPDGSTSTINYCDIEDTQYGEKSYEFHNNTENDGRSSLEMKLRLDITQINQ